MTDNGDGTVTDDDTLLMWQQDDDNTVYNWFEATGQSDPTYNPGGAIDVCGDLVLAGYSDWRTPSILDFMSIVKWDVDDPSISLPYFPSTKSSHYWSSTLYSGSTSQAFFVDFISGATHVSGFSEEKYVRCVRGTPLIFGIFHDNGDGTVSDFSTGLMWQQATGPGVMTSEDARDYCEGLLLAGYSDWRVPQVWELSTIIDFSTYSPSIDTLYFPDTYGSSVHPPYYLTRTYSGGCDWCLMYINFYFGTAHPGYGDCHVRCVRTE